jgi:pyruvate dehydrogenase E1 component alpha subunit
MMEQKDFETIQKEIEAKVNEAINFADESPYPSTDEVLKDLFVGEKE